MLLELLTSVSLTTWFILIVLGLLTWYMMSTKGPANLPPSPGIALPVIGHQYMLGANPRKKFKQWAQQLGNVYSLRLGSSLIVVLNGYETIREALVKQADYFTERPRSKFTRHRPDANHGVIASSGPNWKEQRTVSLNILRDFGMGKNILAEKIATEVEAFMEELKKFKGEPRDLRYLTNVSVSNNICSIMFGRRYELDDPEFLKLMKIINEVLQIAAFDKAFQHMPWVMLLPFDFFNIKNLFKSVSKFRKFIRDTAGTKKNEYDPNNIDNYVAAYVDEMKKKETAGQNKYLDDSNLYRNIDSLFVAGTETTSNTILWCMVYCIYYPEIQEKVYQEIKREVGAERAPTMADKPKLKYLQAVLTEIQRIASIVPLSLRHHCSHDTTINGYFIPEGAEIWPCLDSVLMDEKIWGDPEVFRPERFLDKEGNLIKKDELVPFSMGRRVCLGEGLAKMELFLYMSSLFQNFTILAGDPKNPPPIVSTWGATCGPVSCTFRCVPRKA